MKKIEIERKYGVLLFVNFVFIILFEFGSLYISNLFSPGYYGGSYNIIHLTRTN